MCKKYHTSSSSKREGGRDAKRRADDDPEGTPRTTISTTGRVVVVGSYGSYGSSGVRGERNARADRGSGVSVASTDGRRGSGRIDGSVRFGDGSSIRANSLKISHDDDSDDARSTERDARNEDEDGTTIKR